MKLTSLACTALIALGLTAPAVAKPEMIPHRGIWKTHKGKQYAQNSVEAYFQAADNDLLSTKNTPGQRPPKYVEVDIRAISIDGHRHAVVYHDLFWDRQTQRDFGQHTGNWAENVFEGHSYNIHFLDDNGIKNSDFKHLHLRSFKSGGASTTTTDKLLKLIDFVELTACKRDTILLLDIQSVETMELAGDDLVHNSCPSHTTHRGKLLAERAYLRPFVGKVIPDLHKNALSSELPSKLVSYYGAGNNYVWGINSGELGKCEKYIGADAKDYTEEELWAKGTCQIVNADDTAGFDPKYFIFGALQIRETHAINFSYPYYNLNLAQRTKNVIAAKMNTIKKLYDTYKNSKNYNGDDVIMISSISRPDGALKFHATADSGNEVKHDETTHCLPFKYKGEADDIFLFSPYIYNSRNAHGVQNGYDYVIVDGFKDSSGFLDFDISTEIEHMCGTSHPVMTAFSAGDSDGQNSEDACTEEMLAAHYTDLRKPHPHSNHHHYVWVHSVKGSTDIEAAFKDTKRAGYEVDVLPNLCETARLNGN
ncbi:MAG: hypothetical protein NXH72_13330 [Hyphomonadaceae bacterium]|nr:hypothetical protein [Hyphomonadaceae bacterium]